MDVRPINDLTDSSLGYINHLKGRKYLLPLNQAIYHKEGLMHATSIKPKVPVMSVASLPRVQKKGSQNKGFPNLYFS